jgi:hypothetical protein
MNFPLFALNQEILAYFRILCRNSPFNATMKDQDPSFWQKKPIKSPDSGAGDTVQRIPEKRVIRHFPT